MSHAVGAGHGRRTLAHQVRADTVRDAIQVKAGYDGTDARGGGRGLRSG